MSDWCSLQLLEERRRRQVDCRSASLHEKLRKGVYMTIPERRYGDHDGKDCRKKPSLYELQKTQRACYKLTSVSPTRAVRSAMEPGPYVFKEEDVLLLLCVDYMLILEKDQNPIRKVSTNWGKTSPWCSLQVKSERLRIVRGWKLSNMKGWWFWHRASTVMLSQQSIVLRSQQFPKFRVWISEHFSTIGYEVADECFRYRRLIRIPLEIATHTRPDIAVVASLLVRHANNEPLKHQKTGIKVVKCLKISRSYWFKLQPGRSTQLHGYVDVNWVVEQGNMRCPRAGITVSYGNALIFYRNVMPKCVVLSGTEAEYLVLSDCSKRVTW